MKLKKLICTALSVSLLSVSALALDPTAPGQTAPVSPGPDYTITQTPALPLMLWGNLTADGDRLVLKNDNEGATDYPEVILTIGDDTLILDAVTGESRTRADLKDNELVYAYAGPAMTRSLPPIATAHIIICNFPADFGAPILAEIQQVTTGDDGVVSLVTNKDVILHANKDTVLMSVPGATGTVTLEGLKPGDRVLAWYQIMALSLPAQASPTRMMVFPSTYRGLATLSPAGISIDGKALTLTPEQTPFAADGKLMVPVRPLAEAMGCQVGWSADAPDTVTVTRDGETLYTLTLGDEAVAADGVTFVTAEMALGMLNLKLISV